MPSALLLTHKGAESLVSTSVRSVAYNVKCFASLGNGRLLSGIIGHVMRKGIPVPFCFVTKYELHKFDTVGFIPEGV